MLGDAIAQGGLDGGPGVGGHCWSVVCVEVKGFDEFLGVVTRSSRGLKDIWDQVGVGVPVELTLFPPFGREALAAAGGQYESSTGRERVDDRRVNVVRAACPCEHLPPVHQIG